MFENLKAFIRHGKQAKEPEYQQQYRQQAPGVADLLALLTSEGFVPVAVPETSPSDALATTHPYANPQANASTQSILATQHYQELALQMVEEERAQRSSKKKYPNLDNYEVMEQMGEGAFLIVYKARHLPSDRLVAIKILRKFQMDSAQKNAVFKEVTIMRQLDHPNIVKFIEFIDLEKYYYIVQELVAGGEIFTAIVNYTYLSEDLSRHVIVQVAKAIRYLHEEVGVVHRDIKPENLLYVPIDFVPLKQRQLRRSDDPNTKKDEGEFIEGIGGGGIGLVKLADFGLSKQIWEHNTKTPCGTVGYTAPEIVRDERYSREVDMWAIGCVLYTLLCGFPPFYDERIELLTEKVAKGEYTFLSPWWDEISPAAKNCVSKLLTVDPNKRYTIDEFLQDPWVLNGHQATGASLKPTEVPLRKSKLALQAQAAANGAKQKHPIQQFNQANFNPELYSPAALALRDAFDISTAVHRMEEEKALQSKFNNNSMVFDLVEEEEDEHGEIIVKDPPTHRQVQMPATKTFDLNLGGASILGRRKNKMVTT